MKIKTKIGIIVGGLMVAGGLYFGNMAYKGMAQPTMAKGAWDVSTTEAQEMFPMHMPEKQIIEAIHEMTHQKVSAKEKAGQPVPLTDNTVNRLIKVLKADEDEYFSISTYLPMLIEWQHHDFSHVVEQHNEIELLEGTKNDTKATKAFTNAEEKKYIEDNYGIEY